MALKIAVMIKQVPAVDNVKINEETGTMEREGVESELNPMDLHALEEAIRIKERDPENVRVTAVSMGPAQAEKILKGAVAMGCDDGILLSDRRFAGADTLATARALAACVKKCGPFDLILAGERATDGETGQVAPSVAELLGQPALTYVSAIDELDTSRATITRAIEGGHERIETPLPAVLSVIKEINRPRLTTLGGKLRAKKTNIPTYDAEALGLAEGDIGLKGSPTRVVKVFYPKVTRSGEKYFMAADPAAALSALTGFLADKGCIGEEAAR